MNKALQGFTPREIWLLLLVFCLATGLLFYYWLLNPLLKTAADLQTQLLEAEQELEQRLLYQAEDEITGQQIADLEARRAQLQAQLDVVSHRQELINYFLLLQDKAGATIHSADLAEEDLTLNFSTPAYAQAEVFLEEVEASPNFVIMAASINEGPSDLNLQLKLRLYYGQKEMGAGQIYERVNLFGR